MKSKSCFKCHTVKPLSEFYDHPRMADGHLNKCKACTKLDVRTHRVVQGEKVRAYDKMRSQRPERRAEANRRNCARAKREPHKNRARLQLGRAVARGKVVQLPCVVCGDPKSHGHHEDYSKPLDVIWFCALHHARHHAKKRLQEA